MAPTGPPEPSCNRDAYVAAGVEQLAIRHLSGKEDGNAEFESSLFRFAHPASAWDSAGVETWLACGVHSGTASCGERLYARIMQLEYTKVPLAEAWVVAVCLVGLAAGLTSVFAWIVLAAVAVVPSVLMLKLRTDPPQTMSQTIQEALR